MTDSPLARAATAVADRKKKFLKAADRMQNNFTKSERFKKIVREAWRECDFDNSGNVDAAEVYIAVLLLYLKLTPYVPGCKPPSKQKILALVAKLDVDQTGHLDEQEFTQLCTILCQEVVGRITAEAVTLYIIGPILALSTKWLIGAFFDEGIDRVEKIFGDAWQETVSYVMDMCLVLGCFMVLVPMVSKKVDQYTSRMAARSAERLEYETQGHAVFGPGVLRLARVQDPGTTRLRTELPDGSGLDSYCGKVAEGQVVAVVAEPQGEFTAVRTRPTVSCPRGVEGLIRTRYIADAALSGRAAG